MRLINRTEFISFKKLISSSIITSFNVCPLQAVAGAIVRKHFVSQIDSVWSSYFEKIGPQT